MEEKVHTTSTCDGDNPEPAQAMARCDRECSTECMCTKYHEERSKLKTTRNHEVVLVDGADIGAATKIVPATCVTHALQPMVGCCKLEPHACAICLMSTHKKHDVCSLAGVMTESKAFVSAGAGGDGDGFKGKGLYY